MISLGGLYLHLGHHFESLQAHSKVVSRSWAEQAICAAATLELTSRCRILRSSAMLETTAVARCRIPPLATDYIAGCLEFRSLLHKGRHGPGIHHLLAVVVQLELQPSQPL